MVDSGASRLQEQEAKIKVTTFAIVYCEAVIEQQPNKNTKGTMFEHDECIKSIAGNVC